MINRFALSFLCIELDRNVRFGVTLLYILLSRRLDRCDRMIQNESRDSNAGNVLLFSAATYRPRPYVTMQITFLVRKCPPVRFDLDPSIRKEGNNYKERRLRGFVITKCAWWPVCDSQSYRYDCDV